MKVRVYKTVSVLLSALVVLASADNAFAQKQLKYLPKALARPPKAPLIINPALKPGVRQRLAQLDLEFEVNFARAQAQRTAPLSPVLDAKKAAMPGKDYYPPQFVHFVAWLDLLSQKRLIATRATLQALQTLRQAILAYPTLPPAQQAQVNWLVISLNQFRTAKLGKFKNGSFHKIVYHPADDNQATLPQAQNFHIKREQRGIFKQHDRSQKVLQMPLRSFTFALDYQEADKIVGLTFLQGFQLRKTRQELETVLDALTPPGYTVRMSPHEVGIKSGDLQKFRQGFLHIHFEKIDARISKEIPVDTSIELWLGATPYAGIIDPKTRKIIVPFNDKTIAKNYLFLFQKYLTPEAKKTLEYILW